jgi:hypothetical protein
VGSSIFCFLVSGSVDMVALILTVYVTACCDQFKVPSYQLTTDRRFGLPVEPGTKIA